MPNFSHRIGFDDAPFAKTHRGDVLIVGAVFTANRLDGLLCGKVRRDGANGTDKIIRLLEASRFLDHLQIILLQGIALAGFNVVDIHRLHQILNLPVLVICRKAPDFGAIRNALLTNVPGGKRKWTLIEKAGPMEKLAGVYVQRAGIDTATAAGVIQQSAIHSSVPEPLRTAHIIARDITASGSRQRV